MGVVKPEIIDGIECYCPNVDQNHGDYPATGLDNLYRSERQHFWFLSRCEYIVGVFKKYVDPKERVIEIGAGTGNVARELMAAGYKPAVGELHLSGLRYARSYGIEECYQFDLFDPPFHDRFDVVGMFDVLEHLDNAIEALTQVRSLLHEDGRLILTVPAHMWLWSREDTIAEHKLRYTRSTIAHELTAAGFEIVENRYFFVSILPLLWLRTFLHPDNGSKVIEKEQEKEISLNPVLNRILLWLCRFENRIRYLLPNTFGGSLMVVAKRT